MNTPRLREDEMWCPECGAPIKKGFFTCSNCKLKVRFTREINRQQGGTRVQKKAEKHEKSTKKTPNPKPVNTKSVNTKPPDLEKTYPGKRDVHSLEASPSEKKDQSDHPYWWAYK